MRPKKQETTGSGDLFRARLRADYQHEARAGCCLRARSNGNGSTARSRRSTATKAGRGFVIGLLLLIVPRGLTCAPSGQLLKSFNLVRLGFDLAQCLDVTLAAEINELLIRF